MTDQFTFKGVQRRKEEGKEVYISFFFFFFFIKKKMSFCPVLNDGTEHVQWIYVSQKRGNDSIRFFFFLLFFNRIYLVVVFMVGKNQ